MPKGHLTVANVARHTCRKRKAQAPVQRIRYCSKPRPNTNKGKNPPLRIYVRPELLLLVHCKSGKSLVLFCGLTFIDVSFPFGLCCCSLGVIVGVALVDPRGSREVPL